MDLTNPKDSMHSFYDSRTFQRDSYPMEEYDSF